MKHHKYNLLGINAPKGYRWAKRGDLIEANDALIYAENVMGLVKYLDGRGYVKKIV